jgi:hypothetical protein
MARADVKTWLSLDDFARIIGISPLNFNGLYSPSLQNNNVCGETFFQYSWQHSDRIGREDIAFAIQQAEQEISREAGFNLMPDWTREERLQYPRPGNPEAYNFAGLNVRFQMKSVEANKGLMISGGVRAKSLIQAGAAIVRTDEDTDGYAETCTVTVATSVTDQSEIRAYYPAKDGDDSWEIRPIKVSLSGGNAVIVFKSWQVAAANKMDAIDAEPLDADDATSYETTTDIYRVYNDPSTQAQFIWEGQPDCCGTCSACQLGTQAGCFHIRDQRLGFVVPSPAAWDATALAFTSTEWSACREPDQIRLWYLSGYSDPNDSRPYADLSNYWKTAVAFFAASKFERAVCGCSNVNQFIEKWRRDSAFSSEQEGGFTVTAEQAANRLGTSMGALYAWRRINQNGMRIIK